MESWVEFSFLYGWVSLRLNTCLPLLLLKLVTDLNSPWRNTVITTLKWPLCQTCLIRGQRVEILVTRVFAVFFFSISPICCHLILMFILQCSQCSVAVMFFVLQFYVINCCFFQSMFVSKQCNWSFASYSIFILSFFYHSIFGLKIVFIFGSLFFLSCW